MKKSCLFIGIIVLSAFTSNAQQVEFSRVPDLLHAVSGFTAYSDCALDMNGDFLDDVVRIGNKGLYIDYQQKAGGYTQQFFNIPLHAVPSWSVCAGDLDNNGYSDLLMADLGTVSFLLANANGIGYSEILVPDTVFSQRSTMADINNDGWLDAFICDDLDQSAPFRNMGNGVMIKDTQLIRTSDFPGNYSAIWTDYDLDRDIDLYLTKCLAGAVPGDFRRTNQLYRNNGDGTYTETANTAGLDDNAQSWSTVFEDFDNDGDFDAFIVNHDMQNRLFRNNGDGTFTDVIVSSGINSFDLGAWENASGDFNNDGFTDIFSELTHQLYLGHGDLTFTGQSAPVTPGAIADLNNDGFLDVVKSGQPWLNTGNDNHWIKVVPRGIQSNRSAIGARMELYGQWGIQVKEVRSGQSFSPMGSLTIHFGLGQAQHADSLLVYWPSGTYTRIKSLSSDSTYFIAESACLLAGTNLPVEGPETICQGDTAILITPEGYASYLWSTNDTTAHLTIDAPGFYYAILRDSIGCTITTELKEIKMTEEASPEIFSPQGHHLCQGDTLMLIAGGGENFTWSDGTTGTPYIKVTDSGLFTVAVDSRCETGQMVSAPFDVNLLPSPAPDGIDASILPGDSVVLTAIGQDCHWYDQPIGGNLIGTGCSLQTPALNQSQTYYVESHYAYPGEIQSGGKPDTTGPGGPELQSGSLFFEAWDYFELLTVDVYVPEGSPQGTRFIQLWSGDSLMASKSFSVFTGRNTLHLNFLVSPGQYTIRCPQGNLFRNTGVLSYPFPIGDVGQITSSSFGRGYYYDMYDWKIKTRDVLCISSRDEVHVILTDIISPVRQNNFKLSPNPARGMVTLTLQGEKDQYSMLRLVNITGDILLTQQVNQDAAISVDLSSFPTGLYAIQLLGTGQMRSGYVLKI